MNLDQLLLSNPNHVTKHTVKNSCSKMFLKMQFLEILTILYKRIYHLGCFKLF